MNTGASWRPSLGAWPEKGGVRFRVWAPERREVSLVLEGTTPGPREVLLERGPEGYWQAHVPGVEKGARYRYRLDGEGPFPDPASRSQPEGVHGPSAVVDPDAFAWSATRWGGVALEDLVLYELHVGTFTPEGTFDGAARRLEHLVTLGVTAVELMPVGDFPGRRNWGYDGVSLFAPARCYGTPDDLRRLVDTAHSIGLGVLVDAVYNHLGPDGAYLGLFSPEYFSDRHRTPWGGAVNLDGPASPHVRAFFIENALHWLHEYRFDGLRLDATHALFDDSPRHFLAELQSRVRASLPGRKVLVIAEDSRNLAWMVQPESRGGFGLDAVWADDFHHQVRRHVAGDRDGYYCDYSGTTEDLAKTIRDGWFYQGQPSAYLGKPRGTDPTSEPPRRYVVCLQNHDQVGNRALGERLHHQVDAAVWRAASALLLLVPETPLLFMGQEWAASGPFLYFTDHEPGLGRQVTEGRRREFQHFAAFSEPASRERIPDPQAEATHSRSRLCWSERSREPHAAVERLYRALLALRRDERPGRAGRETLRVAPLDPGAIGVLLGPRPGVPRQLLVVVRLSGEGPARVPTDALSLSTDAQWHERLSTEEPRFVPDPRPVTVEDDPGGLVVGFRRPGALALVAQASSLG
jgi:maltooligosyltrehalose trehalohydrolase